MERRRIFTVKKACVKFGRALNGHALNRAQWWKAIRNLHRGHVMTGKATFVPPARRPRRMRNLRSIKILRAIGVASRRMLIREAIVR